MAQHGFTLERQEHITELNAEVLLYKHRTGAQLLSLINDDENKVFGINFRTPPADSTGVAHILEHSVLCGSRKYPVKEPFVELLKGSLKTFLNAFTYPDRTCYPVASQNTQDFYNLVDVYLDAVFHPRLTPQVLQQEGWHYELENVSDPLIFKGVVFNEMKGANSSPERILSEHIQQSLFPEHTYGVDSGGDPAHIPDLTFADFVAFHRDYYHPSNARIYFCGDDAPDHRLDLLAAYLDEYEASSVNSAVGPQASFSAPREFTKPYAVDAQNEDAPKSMVALNWLLPDGLDETELMALHTLDYVLTGTPAAPLRRTLLESGLGEDLVGGMETELYQPFSSTGLKGVQVGQEEKVVELVLSTLESIVQQGLDAKTIQAALNTLEFRLRENNTGSYPRGLLLMLRALTTWIYDGDPFAALAFETPLAHMKKSWQDDPRFFESLIQRHLLDNPHRTTVFLKPDATMADRQEAAETARLASARQAMTPQDLEDLVASTAELKRLQTTPDAPEDLAKLPRLKLSDLDDKIRTLPLEETRAEDTLIFHHDLFTNGIAYFDLSFDLRLLPQEDLPYLSLFSRALLEMGTQKENFVELSQRIGTYTGGIWPSSLITMGRNNKQCIARLMLRSKAMTSQVDDLLNILKDILLIPDFSDKDRFLQMVLEEKAGEEAGLVPSGHSVVNLRLRAKFEESSWITEQMEGISYLFFLRRLLVEIDQDWPGVQAKLEAIRHRLVNRRTLLCNLTLSGAERAVFEPKLEAFLRALPQQDWAPMPWTPVFDSSNEGLMAPTQVNYVGKGGNLNDVGYTYHGSVSVITRFLRNTWLWDRIRVQGGAYGAFCSFDQFSGFFSNVSYRDPNLLETLTNYDAAGQFLREVDLNQDELTKAIIGTVGDMDSYMLPDAKGYTSMIRRLIGIDDTYRQQIRDQVLGTSAEDFSAFAVYLDKLAETGSVVALGSAETIAAANQQQPDLLTPVKVL